MATKKGNPHDEEHFFRFEVAVSLREKFSFQNCFCKLKIRHLIL